MSKNRLPVDKIQFEPATNKLYIWCYENLEYIFDMDFIKDTSVIQGEPGINGSTWYFGSSSPNSSLGAVGDFYLNNVNGDIYKKFPEVNWLLIGNLKGSQGETGEQGEEGIGGDSGTNKAGTITPNPDGWDGNNEVAVQVIFDIPFPDNQYAVVCTMVDGAKEFSPLWITEKEATGFKIHITGNDAPLLLPKIDWVASESTNYQIDGLYS
jgi:hypothetical protein